MLPARLMPRSRRSRNAEQAQQMRERRREDEDAMLLLKAV